MDKIKYWYKIYLRNSLGFAAVLAFALNLVIETLARQSVFGGVIFLFQSPLIFLYNTLIIFATLSIVVLFRRRVFAFAVISMLWLALGIINGIILSNRMTPFTTKDLSNMGDGLSIVTNYLATWQLILLGVAAVLLILGLVVLFRRSPKKKFKVKYKRNIAAVLIIVVFTFGASTLAVRTGLVDTYFDNLAYAYRDNGVPYCFINTWLNTGIDKPKDYSEQEVESIFKHGELSKNGSALLKNKDDGKTHPNIIMLQLESFFDPCLIEDIKLSQDPIPNFRKLMKQNSSGNLTVPSVGAGTANTEFEIMTGMSVKFFGPGEYPYKGVLTEKTFESIPYDLDSIGYSSHAIHNHRGAFYGRNIVFANLGFDTFTSLEYMDNVIKTPKNWAKDSLLTKQVIDALESTKCEDYVYTISVQGHGKYPDEEVLTNPLIKVTEAPSEELKWQYEYYANQMYEMDQFIADFLAEMKDYGEDIVVVMYGDHLPAIEDLTEENISGRSTYDTEYFIWSNFEMEKKKQDLKAYQLSAELLDRLDIHNGVMVSYHQNYRGTKNYIENLEILGYDILYGEQYVYGGKNPFKPTDLKMGVKDIKIEEIIQIRDTFFIKGKNFTEFSKITLDGEILKTTYLGPTILELKEEVDPEAIDRMKISQVEKNNEILSTTE